jgi:hypothetical protein
MINDRDTTVVLSNFANYVGFNSDNNNTVYYNPITIGTLELFLALGRQKALVS